MKRDLLISIFGGMLLLSCTNRETALTESQIVTPPAGTTELDTYINSTFTAPYNIGVSYTFNEYEIDIGRTLYPPSIDKVRPALETIRRLWVEPYNAQVGDLIRRISPRLLVLVGGYNYNPSGTITLGVAEAGVKITFFNVNQLDLSNSASLVRFIQTIQHEYTHILNQTKPFPAAYKQITPSGYKSTWYNVREADAREDGFITPYSELNELEDFAEMVATMLTNTKADFDNIINGITSDAAKTALRTKENMVADYFVVEYGIDIYELQKAVTDAIAEIASENAPNPTLTP